MLGGHIHQCTREAEHSTDTEVASHHNQGQVLGLSLRKTGGIWEMIDPVPNTPSLSLTKTGNGWEMSEWKSIKDKDLLSILNFIYHGEVASIKTI